MITVCNVIFNVIKINSFCFNSFWFNLSNSVLFVQFSFIYPIQFYLSNSVLFIQFSFIYQIQFCLSNSVLLIQSSFVNPIQFYSSNPVYLSNPVLLIQFIYRLWNPTQNCKLSIHSARRGENLINLIQSFFDKIRIV